MNGWLNRRVATVVREGLARRQDITQSDDRHVGPARAIPLEEMLVRRFAPQLF